MGSPHARGLHSQKSHRCRKVQIIEPVLWGMALASRQWSETRGRCVSSPSFRRPFGGLNYLWVLLKLEVFSKAFWALFPLFWGNILKLGEAVHGLSGPQIALLAWVADLDLQI